MIRRAIIEFLPPSNSMRRLKYTPRVVQFAKVQQSCSWMVLSNNFHRCQHQLAQEGGQNGPRGVNDPPPSQLPSIPPKIKKKQNMFNFFSSRFLRFLDRYQKMLEKKFPGAMKVYQVFVVGFKDFSFQTKDYIVIKKKIIFTPTKVSELNLKEIDLYFRMPSDIRRVGPTLLISALPFANYIVFPIAYYFPKRLLSSHFWTLQQKAQFAVEFQRDRLLNYRPVLRHLQLNIEDIKDTQYRMKAQEIVHRLGSGSHPTIDQILEVKPLFEAEQRYSMQAIHGPHVACLCRAHGIRGHLFRRFRLNDRAELLRSYDIVLRREGLSTLKADELKNACFLRGINAANLGNDEMLKYLNDWMVVSEQSDSVSNSLILHLPILLSYNHPNNWALLQKLKG